MDSPPLLCHLLSLLQALVAHISVDHPLFFPMQELCCHHPIYGSCFLFRFFVEMGAWMIGGIGKGIFRKINPGQGTEEAGVNQNLDFSAGP